MKDLRGTAVAFWICMNYYSVGTTSAFFLAPTSPTSTASQCPYGSGYAQARQSLKRKRIVQRSAWRDWGINWNRLSNDLAAPSENDNTTDRLENMQTEIGALIEELRNKHDANGKEAALQEKLVALSADLEAYRAAAANSEDGNLMSSGVPSSFRPHETDETAESSQPKSKSTRKMSRRMRKKIQKQIGEQLFTKEENAPGRNELHPARKGQVNGYMKPKINGYTDNRYESSVGSQMNMIMSMMEASSATQTVATPPSKMKMAELREALRERGVELKDTQRLRKSDLVALLWRVRREKREVRNEKVVQMDNSSSSHDADVIKMNSSQSSNGSRDRPALPKGNSIEKDALKAFVNGARVNGKAAKGTRYEDGVTSINGEETKNLVARKSDEKEKESVKPVVSEEVKVRQEYFKRRIEEARLRAMSSRTTKKDNTPSSNATEVAEKPLNEEDQDCSQPDIPVHTPEVIVDRYEATSSPYILEIIEETVEISPRRGLGIGSRRFGEPPKGASANKKQRQAYQPPASEVSSSPKLDPPITPERRRFGMEPPRPEHPDRSQARDTDLPKTRIATADTPGEWFDNGPSFSKPPKPFDELYRASERPGMDSPRGPSRSSRRRRDTNPWHRYGEPLYRGKSTGRFGEPPMPSRNEERRSRFGEPPVHEEECQRIEERESWPNGDSAFRTDIQDIEPPLPRPPVNASFMTRSFVDAVFETAQEVAENRKEDSCEESSDETTSALGEAPVSIWETPFPVQIEGNELRTWSFEDHSIQRVQVFLKAEGDTPMSANVDLWHGPDDTPHKMTIYLEDGNLNPLSTVMETPVGHNSLAVENTAGIGNPLKAAVIASDFGNGSHGFGPLSKKLTEMDTEEKEMESGEERSWPISAEVGSVQVLVRTYKRPLHARVELVKSDRVTQAIEIYTEDGLERPFYIVMETPGEEKVVRVLNTAPVGFPMDAVVEPYVVNSQSESNVP